MSGGGGERETWIAPVTIPTRALRLCPLLRGVGLLRTRAKTDIADDAFAGVLGPFATVPVDVECQPPYMCPSMCPLFVPFICVLICVLGLLATVRMDSTC